MRPARAARVLAFATLLSFMLAAPAAAFDLNGGCTLELASTDASGAGLDTATGSPEGGQGGTQDDPFIVDWNGQVAWNGSTGSTVFTNHTWGVSVFNIPTPLQGGDPNDGGETVFTELEGYGASVADYDLRLEQRDTGAGVRIRGNRPLTRMIFWSAARTVCPEPYVDASVDPGQSTTWQITYDFYEVPSR